MNCVLIDIASSGHHVTFMAGFAEALAACGCQPHVVFPVPDAIKEQMRSNGSDPDKVTFHAYGEEDFSHRLHGVALRARWLKRWRDVARTLQNIERTSRVPVDRVFFAWMDPFLMDLPTSLVVNAFFHYRFSGLIFAPSNILKNRSHRMSAIKWVFSRGRVLSLRKCLSVCTLDETLSDELARTFRRRTVAFPDFPDVTLPAHVVRVQAMIRRLSKDRLVIALLGSMEARKGVIDLLRLIKSGSMPHLFLLMAGEIHWHSFPEPESQLLRSIIEHGLAGSYLRFGRLEPEAELNALLSSSDVLYLCYRDFRQSSNFLAKAAHFRIPVLASQEHLIGLRVRRYSLGWTFAPEQRDAFLRVLNRPILNRFRTSKEFIEGACAYEKEHDRAHLPQRFAHALGLPMMPHYIF